MLHMVVYIYTGLYSGASSVERRTKGYSVSEEAEVAQNIEREIRKCEFNLDWTLALFCVNVCSILYDIYKGHTFHASSNKVNLAIT